MLRLYNTLTDKKELFEPVDGKNVKMYVCGPTVYDSPHLGHARCYITWDVLYRYLKFCGYNVTYCRNITDVDDKIINKSASMGQSAEELTRHFYNIFSMSMKDLNVEKPDIEPFATKNLGEMISIIKELINKDFAYEIDGDVYFRVKKFKEYGKLSKQPIEDLENGVRIDNSEKKENPLDFALWKKDEQNGYPSPWGKGRPGWHIECSAMARKHLGKTIDIHAGGADLVFPHHENEIAQSECANGCSFSKYWLHNGFVTINNEKMSKSLGNFLTIDGLLKNYDANTIRLFILTNHYRMPIEFNDEALSAAQNGVKRLKNAINDVIRYIGTKNLIEKPESDEIDTFKKAMDDDLNTSVALSVLFDLANKANKAKDDNNIIAATNYISSLIFIAKILGLDLDKIEYTEDDLAPIVAKIIDSLEFLSDEHKSLSPFKFLDEIIKIRNEARKNKNWEIADKIRTALTAENITIKDLQNETVWIYEQ